MRTVELNNWNEQIGDTILWWGQWTEEVAEVERTQFWKAKRRLSQQIAEKKQHILSKWSRLTEQDLEQVGDSMKILSGKIQLVYGAGEVEADEAVRAYIGSL